MFCSSKEYIEETLKKVVSHQPPYPPRIVEGAKSNLSRIINSYDKPLKLFRTVDEYPYPDPMTYLDLKETVELNRLNYDNCHNGQRKLTFSLIEFLTVSLKHWKVAEEEVLVVYAGASGLAGVIGANLFPQLKFALYDPAPNLLTLMPPFENKAVYKKENQPTKVDPNKQIYVFTDEAGWFTDETALYCRDQLLPMLGRNYIFFISDIRAENEEIDIAQDMNQQLFWTIEMNALAFIFKFRMPYFDEFNREPIQAIYREGLERINPQLYLKERKKAPAQDSILYLDGSLYIQLYPRTASAELRLIGFQRADGRYKIRWYNLNEIEDKVATYNTLYRSHGHFEYKYSAEFLDPDVPYAYELVSELFILIQYLNLIGVKRPKKEEIFQLYQGINDNLTRIVKKDLLTCSYRLGTDAIRKFNDTSPEVIEHYRGCLERLKSKVSDESFSSLQKRLPK